MRKSDIILLAILKEIRLSRYMLEDIWLSCEVVKRDKLNLDILDERFDEELEKEFLESAICGVKK